jgi:hypothetical protein
MLAALKQEEAAKEEEEPLIELDRAPSRKESGRREGLAEQSQAHFYRHVNYEEIPME